MVTYWPAGGGTLVLVGGGARVVVVVVDVGGALVVELDAVPGSNVSHDVPWM
jgi:hypothetical protein